MGRCICIHGHFYQPPRENPWLEEVEVDDSAYPYHDWNARITAECYAPNAASRILDSKKRIVDIVNNYASISFNFGPTLLKWLEQNSPQVYSAILEADKESINRFSGHGSAIAQVYNHVIMPLANSRDKRTQVIWGIKDFVHRYGRQPEGMWLAETAVDLETLDILAEQGISFTLLSPEQASRIKKLTDNNWTDVSKGTVDSFMPYLCRLPGGKSIAIFFYDESLAQELAFGNLLKNGEEFANRMVHVFSRNRNESGLLSVASDGETYGHHHRFADMALAYALYLVRTKNLATVTIFGEYLANNPPTHEVEIRENTSWSCPHGIERWRSDCGCCTHGTIIHDPDAHPAGPAPAKDIAAPGKSSRTLWRQTWRKPLRDAMNWLRDLLVPLYESRAGRYFSDPWGARDDYIEIILDRSPENIERFFSQHSSRSLTHDEKTEALKLLEMQRNAMLMFTSCGWFFDDISGIESVQVLQYACRAMQLAQDVAGLNPETGFIALLAGARSNIPEYQNGADIYRDHVRTTVIDLPRIVFHYALYSLIVDSPETIGIRHYSLKHESYEKSDTGGLRLVTGRSFLHSSITWEEKTLEYAVIHLGDYDFMGGVREHTDDEAFIRLQVRLRTAFLDRDTSLLITTMEEEFGTRSYSLWHLFRDGQREVLFRLLDSTLTDLESTCRKVYRQHSRLIHAMNEMQIPVPKAIKDPVWYIMNVDLNTLLAGEHIDLQKLRQMVNEMSKGQFSPDTPTLDYTASRALTALMKKIVSVPHDIDLFEEINAIFSILAPLSLSYDLWECQNDYFHIGKEHLAAMQKKAGTSDPRAAQWILRFGELGKWLGVKCV